MPDKAPLKAANLQIAFDRNFKTVGSRAWRSLGLTLPVAKCLIEVRKRCGVLLQGNQTNYRNRIFQFACVFVHRPRVVRARKRSKAATLEIKLPNRRFKPNVRSSCQSRNRRRCTMNSVLPSAS